MNRIRAPIRSRRCIWLAWLICCAWTADPTSAQAAEAIKVGAVLPFSGGVELYGRQAKLGLDLAAKEINAGGGILGRPVEVLYEDDKTDPAAAVAATNKLIERDGVLALVGPITSRNLNAMAPVVEQATTRCSTPPTTKAASAAATCSCSAPFPTRSWRSSCPT
jgi:urea transport system substrate-binding protein